MKKRIALAAVAALAGGLIVAAPASAAVPTGSINTTADLPFTVWVADTGATETSTATMAATQLAGASNYVLLKSDDDLATGVAVITVTGSTIVSATVPTNTTDTPTINAAATQVTYVDTDTAGSEVKIATPTAGTITATVAKVVEGPTGQFTTTTLQTITITVTAAGVSGVISSVNSTADMVGVDGVSVLDTTDSMTVTAAKGTARVANITVALEDANGLPVSGSAADATIIVAGVGMISVDTTTVAQGRALSVTDDGNGTFVVSVFGDGTAGTGTVTITAGAFVATRSFIFYGDVATLTATAVKKNIKDGAETEGVLLVVAKDAAGNIVPDQTLTIAAADTTAITTRTAVASASATPAEALAGLGTIALTAAADKSGKQTLTVTFDALVDVTTTVDIVIADPQATTLTIAADKAEYAPGEKMTFTFTAKDKNGLGLPDGVYAPGTLVAASATNPAVTTALTSIPFESDTITVSAGVATTTAYAPIVAGPLSIVWTLAGTAGGAATDNLAAALVGTTVTSSVKVVAPVDATATAINAKVASTEATVAALQVTVASIIKSLKVQWWLLKKIAVKVGIKLG